MTGKKAAEGREQQTMAQAQEFEASLGDRAAEVWEKAATDGETAILSGRVFLELWPILREPIPPAFIQHVPKLEKGKPYESTGIRSVQVLIDRMNNVLTPLWWWQEIDYADGGKLCHVAVRVGDRNHFVGDRHVGVLAEGESWGGVDRGSSTGNVYKGSYTNAAKRAFAALGLGHEVYLGAADLDPDVSAEMAEAAQPSAGKNLAEQVWARVNQLGLKDRLQLAASHVAERDVGDCGTKAKAVKALSELTVPQLERLDRRLQAIADERAAKGESK